VIIYFSLKCFFVGAYFFLSVYIVRVYFSLKLFVSMRPGSLFSLVYASDVLDDVPACLLCVSFEDVFFKLMLKVSFITFFQVEFLC